MMPTAACGSASANTTPAKRRSLIGSITPITAAGFGNRDVDAGIILQVIFGEGFGYRTDCSGTIDDDLFICPGTKEQIAPKTNTRDYIIDIVFFSYSSFCFAFYFFDDLI